MNKRVSVMENDCDDEVVQRDDDPFIDNDNLEIDGTGFDFSPEKGSHKISTLKSSMKPSISGKYGEIEIDGEEKHEASEWRNKLKQSMNNFLTSPMYAATIAIFTLWALFSDDIRLGATDKSSDLGFSILISIIFFAFILEMAIRIWCEEGYFVIPVWDIEKFETNVQKIYRLIKIGSFYFWVDFLSTLTLVVEVSEHIVIIIICYFISFYI